MELLAPVGADLVQLAHQAGVERLELQYADVLGALKSVTIPPTQLEGVLSGGCWFDGSSLDAFTRTSETDLYLRPDPGSFALLPWAEVPTARLICTVVDGHGETYPGDPRSVLIRALQSWKEKGYTAKLAPEIEFYLLPRDRDGSTVPPGPDQAGYFDHAIGEGAGTFARIVSAIGSCGYAVQSTHHEVAPEQYEIDLAPADPLQTADALLTVRQAARSIAHSRGMLATFMPKPFNDRAGSGLHIHQGLYGAESGQNLFAGQSGNGLSHAAKAFLAGQLHHAAGMTLVLAPSVNSYKRLVRGFEAPIFISWARTNRGALLRVPEVSDPARTRIELRSPDAISNPYLAIAVMLSCGIDGIEKDLSLPPPVEEALYELDDQELQRRNVQVLPDNLKEAIDAFERDLHVQDILGPHLCERLLAAKRQEWNDYRGQVGPWEVARYL